MSSFGTQTGGGSCCLTGPQSLSWELWALVVCKLCPGIAVEKYEFCRFWIMARDFLASYWGLEIKGQTELPSCKWRCSYELTLGDAKCQDNIQPVDQYVEDFISFVFLILVGHKEESCYWHLLALLLQWLGARMSSKLFLFCASEWYRTMKQQLKCNLKCKLGRGTGLFY